MQRFFSPTHIHGRRLGLVSQADITEQVLKRSVSHSTQLHGLEEFAEHALKGGTHVIEARRVDDEAQLSAGCSNARISLAGSRTIVSPLATFKPSES